MSTRVSAFMDTAWGAAVAGAVAAALCAAPGAASASPLGSLSAGVAGPYRHEMSRLEKRIGELAEVERRVRDLNRNLERAVQSLMEVTGEVEGAIVDDDRITPREQLRLVAEVLEDGLGRMKRDLAGQDSPDEDEAAPVEASDAQAYGFPAGMEAREAELVASIDSYSSDNESALETVRQVSAKLDLVIAASRQKDSDELKAFDVLVEAMDLLPGAADDGSGSEAPLP